MTLQDQEKSSTALVGIEGHAVLNERQLELTSRTYAIVR